MTNDATREVRNYHRRQLGKRDMCRLLAITGVLALAINVGIAFGQAVIEGANPWTIIAISVWGCFGMTYLATRH